MLFGEEFGGDAVMPERRMEERRLGAMEGETCGESEEGISSYRRGLVA
jgi:hypothetical protein